MIMIVVDKATNSWLDVLVIINAIDEDNPNAPNIPRYLLPRLESEYALLLCS